MTGTAPASASDQREALVAFEVEDHDQNDVAGRKGSLSKRMFQRAATVAHNAGVSLSLTHDHGRHKDDNFDAFNDEQEIDKR